MKNQLKLSMRSLSDNVSVARLVAATVAAEANLTLHEVDEIKVAVSEAVSNAVIHGYEGREDGVVEFAAEIYEDRIVYIVSDCGKGIADVEAAREPAYSSDPERMGLGFAFMESFMDELAVTSAPGEGTIVRMTKRLPQQSG